MSEKTRIGRFDCGAVRYEVRGDLGDISLCHCHQCRRLHGGPAPYTRCDRDRLTIREDRGLKWHRSSEAGERGFCGDCGASLFTRFQDDPLVYLCPGSLDDDTGLKTTGHILGAHRGHSYEITDDLPKAAEFE